MNLLWRIAHKLYKSGVFVPTARFFEILNYIIGANAISAKSEIGSGTKFFHRGVAV